MDGLHRVSAAPQEIALCGRTLLVEQPTAGLWGQVEAHLVGRRPNPLLATIELIDQIPAEHRAAAWQAAYQALAKSRTAAPDEVQAFLNSFEGACYLLWLLARSHQPELTHVEQVAEMARSLPLEELQARLDAATGRADLGN